MMVSIERCFGRTWIVITPDHEWYYAAHMYTDNSYIFYTLGM